jgi:hypothetical protein
MLTLEGDPNAAFHDSATQPVGVDLIAPDTDQDCGTIIASAADTWSNHYLQQITTGPGTISSFFGRTDFLATSGRPHLSLGSRDLPGNQSAFADIQVDFVGARNFEVRENGDLVLDGSAKSVIVNGEQQVSTKLSKIKSLSQLLGTVVITAVATVLVTQIWERRRNSK